MNVADTVDGSGVGCRATAGAGSGTFVAMFD